MCVLVVEAAIIAVVEASDINSMRGQACMHYPIKAGSRIACPQTILFTVTTSRPVYKDARCFTGQGTVPKGSCMYSCNTPDLRSRGRGNQVRYAG